jgi:peptidoglycan/LPS O-acetylase OafA/YrhL
MFWPLLGAVRFFLALIVACSHVYWVDRTSAVIEFGRLSGLAAVIGFLVLSGLSIAASYERERVGYYSRRAIRILPLYVLAIVFSALCTRITGPVVFVDGPRYDPPSWGDAPANLVFAQGFFADSIVTNPVVWTLSIEVFFYAITPMLARLTSFALAAICAASFALFAAAPYFEHPFYGEMRHGAGAAMLGWAWLLGFVVFRLPNRILGGAVVAVVCIAALSLNPDGLLRMRLWGVTLGIVAAAMAFGPEIHATPRVSKAMGFLGDISYPLYLFHVPLYLLLSGMGVPRLGGFVICAALLAAILLDRYYDKPIKRALKQRLCPQIRRSAVAVPLSPADRRVS